MEMRANPSQILNMTTSDFQAIRAALTYIHGNVIAIKSDEAVNMINLVSDTSANDFKVTLAHLSFNNIQDHVNGVRVIRFEKFIGDHCLRAIDTYSPQGLTRAHVAGNHTNALRIMPRGAHEGQSFFDLYTTDQSYCQWIIGRPATSFGEPFVSFQEFVRECDLQIANSRTVNQVGCHEPVIRESEAFTFFKLVSVQDYQTIKETGIIPVPQGAGGNNWLSKELTTSLLIGTCFSNEASSTTGVMRDMVVIKCEVNPSWMFQNCCSELWCFTQLPHERSINVKGEGIQIRLTTLFAWSVRLHTDLRRVFRQCGILTEWNSVDLLNAKELWRVSGLTGPFTPVFSEDQPNAGMHGQTQGSRPAQPMPTGTASASGAQPAGP